MYILLKIHKDPINPPGCPIVSSMESVTAPLAQFLDRCLTSFSINTRLYRCDTSDFFNKVREIGFTSDSFLITWDVSSLYTVIPHELGMEAC